MLLTVLLIWCSTPSKAMFCVCVLAVSEFFNGVLKFLTQRPRPFWLKSPTSFPVRNVEGGWESDFSFPSSHAQTLSSFFCAIIIKFTPGTLVQLFLATVLLCVA